MPATERAPEISVVVPVYRNATRLPELAARLERTLRGRPYELIFVNDASPDDAAMVLAALARDDGRVTSINLAQNVGQNAAVVAGLARASGNTIVVMDGDLQDPPHAILALYSTLDHKRVDVVFAGRSGRYEGVVRLATGRLLKLALWALTRGKVPPTAGLFIAMRYDVAQRAVAAAPHDPYVPVLVARAARSVATVPVKRQRTEKTSYTPRMRARVARRALAAAVRR